MKKRQAFKIELRYAITGNQPVIYTQYQLQTAFKITDPIKDRKPMQAVVTSFDSTGLTYEIRGLPSPANI